MWSEDEQALYWVDVRAPAVRRFDYATNTTTTFSLPELVGSLALRAGGGLILAMTDCIAHFDPFSQILKPFAWPVDPCQNQRFNESKCDRLGRLWAGTMDDLNTRPVGRLYRLDNNDLSPVLDNVIIPNSLCWSPDSRTMYYSNTTTRVIDAYDFDAARGIPSRRREFARVPPPGMPDGSTVDAEGFLWNAEYDGWRITRYAPDGRVDRTISLPVQRPTCCVFGGPDLSVLFITTASRKLTQPELAAQPLAGSLLAMDTRVRGLAEPCVCVNASLAR